MNESLQVACPYCGEAIVIEPEPSDELIEYVEDCHVCCRPIVFRIHYATSGSQISAKRENE